MGFPDYIPGQTNQVVLLDDNDNKIEVHTWESKHPDIVTVTSTGFLETVSPGIGVLVAKNESDEVIGAEVIIVRPASGRFIICPLSEANPLTMTIRILLMGHGATEVEVYFYDDEILIQYAGTLLVSDAQVLGELEDLIGNDSFYLIEYGAPNLGFEGDSAASGLDVGDLARNVK